MTTAHLNASHADQIIYDTENKFFSNKFIHTHTPVPVLFLLLSKKNVLLFPHADAGAVGLPKVIW